MYLLYASKEVLILRINFVIVIKPQTIKMSDANNQDRSMVMTVISANIEGLTASKASMLSEMCKREHCHCVCVQEIHRAPSSKAEDNWNDTHG